MSREVVIRIDAETGGYKAKVEQTNRFSQDAIRGSQQTAAAWQNSQRALGGVERGAISTRVAFGPFNAAIGQVTQLLGPAAQAVDNFAVTILATAAASGTWAGALRVATALLNPWVGLVVGGSAALAYFAGKSRDSAKAQEELTKAIETGNIDKLQQAAKAAADELGRVERKFEDVLALQAKLNAPPGSPLARAQEAGAGQLRGELGAASRASGQADRDLQAARQKALPSLDDLKTNLELQNRLAQASERRRPLIEAEAKAQELLAKGYTETQVAEVKSLLVAQAHQKIRDLDIKALDEQQNKLNQQLKEQQSAEASALKSVFQMEQGIREKIIALEGGAEALEEHKLKTFQAALAMDVGADSAQKAVDALRKLTGEVREMNRERELELILLGQLKERADEAEQYRQAELQFLERKKQLQQAAGQHEVALLRARGAPEAQVLARQLEILRAEEQRRLTQDISRDELLGLPALRQQIELVEAQMERLGKTTINVGHSIADTLVDIAEGMATGTLKGFDIVKAAGSSMLRLVADILRQTLQQKLSFELNLFNNLRGLPGQANAALAGGISTLPAGGINTGGGLIGGLNGGGGFGNFLGSIFGTQIGGSSLGGIAAAGLGGFGLARATGAGGLGQILSTIGSIGGNILGNVSLGSVTLGSSVFSGFTASGLVTELLGSVLGAQLAGMIGDFIIPGIGSIIGLVIGQLFSSVPNPTVNLRARFSGFKYDELLDQFLPPGVRTGITGT